MEKLLILTIFLFSLTFNVMVADSSNISRLQLRSTEVGDTTIAQSTYIQFPNKLFLLELYEYQASTQGLDAVQHLDLNVGGGNTVVDWVTRGQKYNDISAVYSAGVQMNITELPALKQLIQTSKLHSFIQAFPLRNNEQLGRFDVLHYYSVPIVSDISIRGYNQYIVRETEPDLFYPWTDIIVAVNRFLDIYSRVSYLSSFDRLYGQKGWRSWLGVRLNYSFR